MTGKVTEEMLKRCLPKGMKLSITDELLSGINKSMGSSLDLVNFRDNLLGYTHVLKDGRFKLENYIDAVKYVSYKLLGSSNVEAYTKVFPDRFQRFVDEGVGENTIASYISSYNKNKLVNLVLAQTMVPVHVLNADLHQRAINAQAELMLSAKSEKVRCDAANSLLTHLKVPEVAKIELDIGIKEDKVIDELRRSTMDLVAQQRKAIEIGMASVEEIAHSTIISEKVIEGEVLN